MGKKMSFTIIAILWRGGQVPNSINEQEVVSEKRGYFNHIYDDRQPGDNLQLPKFTQICDTLI